MPTEAVGREFQVGGHSNDEEFQVGGDYGASRTKLMKSVTIYALTCAHTKQKAGESRITWPEYRYIIIISKLLCRITHLHFMNYA